MTFTSKVCTIEKSCQVRRVKAVQDLSLKLGHGAEDSLSGKLSPSSGKDGVIWGEKVNFSRIESSLYHKEIFKNLLLLKGLNHSAKVFF